ncbi:hypothetical protein ZWY2020_049123 [Hordeum vulgare]|nr:hypothetical protein ZWY2020_049123 [Hordeum vulgare]
MGKRHDILRKALPRHEEMDGCFKTQGLPAQPQVIMGSGLVGQCGDSGRAVLRDVEERNLDMSHVLDDATSAAHDAYDDAMLDTMPDDAMLDTMPDDAMLDTMPDDAMLDTMPDDAMLDTMPDDAMLDTTLPLGVLDAQIARVAARRDDTFETIDTIEVEPATMPELPVMPDMRYVMEGEIAEDFFACKDSYDVDKLLRKWKEKSLNARMKYDLKFATSPIFVTDKDYEFSRLRS